MGVSIGVCATVIGFTALYYARPVFAPLAFALLIIALVWPIQKRLQKLMPQVAALAVTIAATTVIVMESASLVTWSFGRVGSYVGSNGSNFQVVYRRMAAWLEEHGVAVVGVWAEHFNVGWLIALFREITLWMSGALTFTVIMLTYVILGLLEVDSVGAKLRALQKGRLGQSLFEAAASIGDRFRRYMLVRTVMSVITGLLVWAFASAVGLELALEWGVIAFMLNYIPVIGAFAATVFPTVAAIAQFGSWQMVLVVFVCLNLIQFLTGSYLEPRMTGRTLSLSPFIVLFAVFFWTFMWGIAGAFIGVPIVIAIVTLCEQYPSSRWIAELLAAPGRRPASCTDAGAC